MFTLLDNGLLYSVMKRIVRERREMLMTSYPVVSINSEDHAAPHLLVVDDESINRELFRRVFEYDYRMTIVVTGEQALDAFSTYDFDAVLLDVNLPGMSGYDVLRAIRHDLGFADLPVIMVSARSEERDVLDALRSGANDYIAKPFSVEVARARVRTHVELKQTNDRKKLMIEELQKAQQMQESFYRIVSHDLKGPLTNIRLAQSLLREMVQDSADANEILDTIEVTVQDMQEMIRMFLDASAVQSGQLEMQMTCVIARDILYAAADRIAFPAQKKGISLRFPQTEGYVFGDPRLLSQVLVNLLSNALKFSPPGSEVNLWSETLTDGQVCFYVADQGPGIPPDERDSLFEMFRQLSPRSTHGEAGHGLGLWIVRQLVELMNGRVGYSPASGGGSIFWVCLPACSLNDRST